MIFKKNFIIEPQSFLLCCAIEANREERNDRVGTLSTHGVPAKMKGVNIYG